MPTKTTITLDIEAQDVAHSWWIPALGGKFDAVPGHTNFTWFKIEKPGVYRGQCAELCGRNHADMVAQVRAISPADFKQWLVTKKQEIDDSDAAALKRRQPTRPPQRPRRRREGRRRSATPPTPHEAP